jgi:hypothetical protein
VIEPVDARRHRGKELAGPRSDVPRAAGFLVDGPGKAGDAGTGVGHGILGEGDRGESEEGDGMAVPGGERLGVAEILVALVLRCRRCDCRNELGCDLPHGFVDVGVVAPEPPRVVVLGAEPVRVGRRIELPEEPHGVVALLEIVAVEAQTVVVGDERAVLDQVVIQGLGERPETCVLAAVVLAERLEETPPGGGDAPLLVGRHEPDIDEIRHGGLGGRDRERAGESPVGRRPLGAVSRACCNCSSDCVSASSPGCP